MAVAKVPMMEWGGNEELLLVEPEARNFLGVRQSRKL